MPRPKTEVTKRIMRAAGLLGVVAGGEPGSPVAHLAAHPQGGWGATNRRSLAPGAGR